ncbi:MAG TPA: hypothetical protein VIB79_10875 [Candidatus Binatia bacterium]|jgi:hypothetical protein
MESSKSHVIYFATLILMFLTASCAGTTNILVSQWSNPSYQSTSFRRIIVGGAGTQTSIRRNFEDELVKQLRADGVDAVPSYRYIPELDNADLTRVKKAGQEAGADAAILARAVNIEQKTDFTPGYYPVPSFGFFGPYFGAGWYGGYYGYPSVYRYDVYTSEVTFYDLRKNEVVWTGSIKSTETDDVHAGIRSYVETVIKALEERNLIDGRR